MDQNIITNFRQLGDVLLRLRGGAYNWKTYDETTVYKLRKMEAKPAITLKELIEQIRVDLPDKPHVTHQAVSKMRFQRNGTPLNKWTSKASSQIISWEMASMYIGYTDIYQQVRLHRLDVILWLHYGIG